MVSDYCSVAPVVETASLFSAVIFLDDNGETFCWSIGCIRKALECCLFTFYTSPTNRSKGDHSSTLTSFKWKYLEKCKGISIRPSGFLAHSSLAFGEKFMIHGAQILGRYVIIRRLLVQDRFESSYESRK